MKNAGMLLNTVAWVTDRKSVLYWIEKEIDQLLDGSTTGCFIVKLKGPMSSDEVAAEEIT